MELINKKLSIRNATPEDASLLAGWWNDGSVMAHAGFPNGLDISEKKVNDFIKEENDLNRRMILELANKPIGEMSYSTVADKVAEIGIKICDESEQNKGYGKTFIMMLMEYLFIKMGYKKIKLDTNLENQRAQHVYENLGFQKIKINMDTWKNQLGEMQSSVDYEITIDVYSRLNCS